MEEIQSSKFKCQIKSKAQISKIFGFWVLGLIWILGFGFWIFIALPFELSLLLSVAKNYLAIDFMVTIDQVKKLREETGVSIGECQKALKDAQGDVPAAKELLRKRGKDFVAKKMSRETGQGIIDCYLHSNKKTGVLLELCCETDFVAKSEIFQKLAHEICLQIAAMNPMFINEEAIPEEFLAGERKIYQEQLRDCGKPEKIIAEIVEGKLKKYKEEISLLSQPYIRDEAKTIKDLIDENIAKLGENIAVKRFARFEI